MCKNSPSFWTDTIYGTAKADKHSVTSCLISSEDRQRGLKYYMNDKHYAMINASPFKEYLHFPRGIQMRRIYVELFLRRWDPDKRGIRIGIEGSTIPFKCSDFSNILGLAVKGEIINFEQKHVKVGKESLFYRLTNGESKNFNRLRIRKMLFDVVKVNDDDSVVAFYKLFLCLLFMTILFPTIDYTMPRILIRFIDNLEVIDNVAWGKAVFDYISRRIGETAVAIKNLKIAHLNGCCLAINVCFQTPYFHI